MLKLSVVLNIKLNSLSLPSLQARRQQTHQETSISDPSCHIIFDMLIKVARNLTNTTTVARDPVSFNFWFSDKITGEPAFHK